MTRIAIWADGTYCEEEDLEEYLSMMSDDFTMLEVPDNVDDIDEWLIDNTPDQIRVVLTKDAKVAFVRTKGGVRVIQCSEPGCVRPATRKYQIVIEIAPDGESDRRTDPKSICDHCDGRMDISMGNEYVSVGIKE